MTDTSSGPGPLPLPALLSQVLMAFIVEFDNEFERQMPHRTSDHGRTQGPGTVPWLVSMAMWSTCLRFVGDDGITVSELAWRARTGTNLAGMQRWGYITVAPDPADTRSRPPRSDWVIHATASGRQAQKIWRPLTGVIEDRWAERFGGETITALRQALDRLVSNPGARLSKGLEPLPGGWRASVRRPDTLAQYPMVLHRGGFPDGS